MSKPLTVERYREGVSVNVMKVTGLTDKELSELNSMEYREMIDTFLTILDQRNPNLGSCWHNGYGVYTVWINNGAVYAEIGKSCD